MKCDELKSLWVYSRDINENCDEEFVNFAKENGYEELVEKKEVNEAIEELKQFAEDACLERDDNQTAIDELQAENEQLKKEIEFMHSNCKWGVGDGCARLLGEKLAIIDDNVKLKQKLESVQASMYCDVVDAGMENRRLRRALWLARAERASDKALIFYFSMTESYPLNINGYSDKEKGHTRMRNAIWWRTTWLKVERKCRAKAEEYK